MTTFDGKAAPQRRISVVARLHDVPRAEVLGALLIAAVALLPVLVTVATRWAHPYVPILDTATIDMRVRDVWSRDIPLVGAYSRYGWNHPGPAMYWLIAPFSLVFGRPAWATLVGGALLQGLAVAWAARLAWARGRLLGLLAWLAVITFAYTAAYQTTGVSILLEAFNPYLAFPFFALFLLQLWALSTGDVRRLGGMAFVGSFLVQTHVGYLPFVVVLGGWALYRLRGERPRAEVPLWKLPPARRASIVLAVMWLPVLLDCLVHFPGNAPRLIRNLTFGSGGQSPIGLRLGAGLLAREFRWLPPWLGGHDPVGPFTALTQPSKLLWLAIPALLIVLATLVARRTRRVELLHMTELLALTFLLAIGVLARVTGGVFPVGGAFPYLFVWRYVVGPYVVVFSVWVIVQSLNGRARRQALNVVAVVLTVGIVGSSVSLAASMARAPTNVSVLEPVVRSFVRQLRQLQRPSSPVLVRMPGSIRGLGTGMVDELDRAGVPVRVDGGEPYQFGHRRVATLKEVSAVWYVVEGSVQLSLMSASPGATVLVRTRPLNAADDAELTTLQRAVASQLTRAGHPELINSALNFGVAHVILARVSGVDLQAASRIDELTLRALRAAPCRCAVISFPPSQA